MTSRWMNLKRSGPRSPTFDAELRWPRLEPKKGNALSRRKQSRCVRYPVNSGPAARVLLFRAVHRLSSVEPS